MKPARKGATHLLPRLQTGCGSGGALSVAGIGPDVGLQRAKPEQSSLVVWVRNQPLLCLTARVVWLTKRCLLMATAPMLLTSGGGPLLMICAASQVFVYLEHGSCVGEIQRWENYAIQVRCAVAPHKMLRRILVMLPSEHTEISAYEIYAVP